MVFCGFTGGRREKRSPNYLCVKNSFSEKREEKRDKKAARKKIEKKREQKETEETQ